MPPRTRSAHDTNIAKALSHPVRIKALQMMSEGVASPSDVAKALQIPVANVSYHVKALVRLGCIEEVEQRPVRGAIEHRYRAVTRSHARLDTWKTMPELGRHSLATTVARNAFEDLRAALQADDFNERDDVHISWTRVTLDDEGWANLATAMDELLDKVIAEQAAAIERMRARGEEGIPATISLFHHKSGPRT